MLEFFSKLFDTTDFPARWYCGNWTSGLGWLHVLSDVATWAAYTAIPVVLILYVRKRQDFPFHRLFWLFAAFILACGSVHLVEALIFWHPVYRVSGLLKLITAVVSWATVIALARVTPRVLHLPSLAATNDRLTKEIAEREQTESDLRVLQARYEALLTGTRSIVWTCDGQGQFVTAQPSWERYTGQTWQRHQGLGWIDAIHADDRADIIKLWKQAVASGSLYRSAGRIWHPSSESYRPFVAEAVPVLDESQHVIEWVGTVSDVHEQRMAEEALRIAEAESSRQKRELELLYDSAPVGMCLIDREHRYLRINESLAKINGYPRDFHYGKKGSELLPQLVEMIDPLYELVFRTGDALLNIEITGKTPASDQERCWLVSYHPLKNEEGDVWAVSSIVQDITERKSMEQTIRDSEVYARQANLAKSQFLANMSHEIRTPMAAILGYADVLMGHLKDPDNRNCVLVMKRNGEHLLEIINDILDLSRIEAGKLEVDLASCDLTQLIGDLQSLMQVRADEKELQLHVRSIGLVPKTITIDATRIRQVLINLVGNAIKFTDQGEVSLIVRLISEPAVPFIEFEVRDTGIGISSEQQANLFQPFSQGDTSVTRAYGGSGLGLAISQRFVEMHGGKITIKSGLGVGSSFFVWIPIGSLHDEPLIDLDLNRQQDHETSSEMRRRLNCRVLVVDDRRDVRYISQHFLEAAGAKVTTAEDGQQGIAAVHEAIAGGSPFDVIVMDMQMPNVDGRQATAMLRSAGIHKPIIALTADAMKGDRESCLRAGCDDYISKPIDHVKFVDMIAKYSQDFTTLQLQERRRQRAEKLRLEFEGSE